MQSLIYGVRFANFSKKKAKFVHQGKQKKLVKIKEIIIKEIGAVWMKRNEQKTNRNENET